MNYNNKNEFNFRYIFWVFGINVKFDEWLLNFMDRNGEGDSVSDVVFMKEDRVLEFRFEEEWCW